MAISTEQELEIATAASYQSIILKQPIDIAYPKKLSVNFRSWPKDGILDLRSLGYDMR